MDPPRLTTKTVAQDEEVGSNAQYFGIGTLGARLYIGLFPTLSNVN